MNPYSHVCLAEKSGPIEDRFAASRKSDESFEIGKVTNVAGDDTGYRGRKFSLQFVHVLFYMSEGLFDE